MSDNSSGTVEKKKLTTTQKILIIGFGLVLAVAIAAIVIFMILNKKDNDQIGNYVIDKSNYEDVMNDMEEKAKAGTYEVTMNTIWNFDNGKAVSSDANVTNSTANNSPVFFEVFLSDTNELIYTSTVLPVGTKLKELKLEKSLAKGTYPAICKYNLLDDKGAISSSLSVAVTINIAK